METDLFASRLAMRLRVPIAAVGFASLCLAVANLTFDAVNDRLIIVAAGVVALPAIGMTLSAVLDIRFQRAASSLNAQWRARNRVKGEPSAGWASRFGDPLLATLNISLVIMVLVAANALHRGATTALLLAAFFLGSTANMALMVRGQPSDRWFNPFA